jgi:hypothetical protein
MLQAVMSIKFGSVFHSVWSFIVRWIFGGIIVEKFKELKSVKLKDTFFQFFSWIKAHPIKTVLIIAGTIYYGRILWYVAAVTGPSVYWGWPLYIWLMYIILKRE